MIEVHPWRSLFDCSLEKRIASFLEWLCPNTVNPMYDQSTHRDLRTENTAVWIFEHPQYKEWRTGSSNFIWIYGQSTHNYYSKS